MAKRKYKFTYDMKAKHPCFRKGRNDWEAEYSQSITSAFHSVENHTKRFTH